MLKLCKKKFYSFHETAEIRPGSYIIGCSQISLGKRVVIRPGTMLFGLTENGGVGINIEDDVMIGSSVHIYVANHSFDRTDIPIIDQGYNNAKSVTLKKGCWIGAGSILLPGVAIGENTVIGAGSIVTKSFPAGVIVAGNPAKIIRSIKQTVA